ncbi:hypothetical protein DZC71_07535, partial [Campylobacter hepaticus]|uniref:beta strand repeat-containing protein n=1 Tax=Campylobacter hepaticus TaxID=1813019 RepID=UPI000FF842B3
LILSLATISCLSSLALAQISGPEPAIKFNPEGYNYSYYGILGYAPGTQIDIRGNNSTNSLFLGRYAYVKNGSDGSRTIFVSATTDEKIDIRKILNKGIIAGSLNIQNRQDINNGSIHVGDIDNQGYIRDVYIGIWKENHATLTLDSFKNSGIIYNTSDNGILFEGKDVKIGKFINTGIISGNKNDKASISIEKGNQGNKRNDNITINLLLNKGLIGGEHSKYGILISGDNTGSNPDNFKIDHLINTGVIYGEDEAIFLNRSTLTNFLNTGTIKANNNRGIETHRQTKIKNFINAGSIISNGNTDIEDTSAQSSDAALVLRYSNITNFINTGLLAGKKIGVNLFSSTIQNFINTGVIVGASTHNQASAIYVISLDTTKNNITTLRNNGLLIANNGIGIGDNNTVGTIINKGIIAANSNGITFLGYGGGQTEITVNEIILENDSQIIANKNGINLDLGSNAQKNVSVGSINIETGASIHAKEAGIKIGQSKDVQSNSSTGKDNTVGQIIVAGEIQGGSEGGIVNEGTIKADANGSKTRKRRSIDEDSQQNDEENKAAIIVEETAKITADNGKAGIINKDKGKIEGDIISKSSSEISLENQGSVKGNISNTGNGSLMFKNSSTLTGNISNSGSGSLMIENKNNNGSNSASITGSITNSGLGTLDLMNNASITGNIANTGDGNLILNNTGSITKGITNSGSGTLMLNNSGSIGMNDKGYNISNEGDGSVNITSWTIRTDDTTKSLQTLTVGGRSANSVMVENLIVDQSNLNMDELNDINNLVSGVSLN